MADKAVPAVGIQQQLDNWNLGQSCLAHDTLEQVEICDIAAVM